MLPLVWRHIKYRYELIGSHCKICDSYYYPPREICPKCRRKGKFEEVVLPETGKVLSYTVNDNNVIALIELENGVRIISQLVCRPEEVRVGMTVKRVFRRYGEDGDSGIIYYGTKFVKDVEM